MCSGEARRTLTRIVVDVVGAVSSILTRIAGTFVDSICLALISCVPRHTVTRIVVDIAKACSSISTRIAYRICSQQSDTVLLRYIHNYACGSSQHTLLHSRQGLLAHFVVSFMQMNLKSFMSYNLSNRAIFLKRYRPARQE